MARMYEFTSLNTGATMLAGGENNDHESFTVGLNHTACNQ